MLNEPRTQTVHCKATLRAGQDHRAFAKGTKYLSCFVLILILSVNFTNAETEMHIEIPNQRLPQALLCLLTVKLLWNFVPIIIECIL